MEPERACARSFAAGVHVMHPTHLLAALPVAVYMTDAESNLTFYNDAAADLWRHRPTLGAACWCWGMRLFLPDGRPLRPEDTPLAACLREGRATGGEELLIERPDGSRVLCLSSPSLLRDGAGRITGAIDLLRDQSDRQAADLEAVRLAAIVSCSDDAIVSKTLTGHITSWNAGAERIFGYRAEEMVGEHITRIIPPELHGEEERILARLRRGERIEHYDTERITKDGRRVAISLSVSPLRDRHGNLVGASKVARDFTERKRAEEMQRLLFSELNHRVKNTLAMIQAIARQSLRAAPDPNAFVQGFSGRIQALARAHDLLAMRKMRGADIIEVIREQVMFGVDPARVVCAGPQIALNARVAMQLALVLHELATNASKHGALSVPSGRLAIGWSVRSGREGRELLLDWRESGMPSVAAPVRRGFGTTLIERTLYANGGEARIRYEADGLVCAIELPLAQDEHDPFQAPPSSPGEPDAAPSGAPAGNIAGKRILVVEDEAFIAMEIESELSQAGMEVVGPAASVDAALRLVESEPFEAALLDANLAGRSVEAVAAALVRKRVPFGFATGYGRQGLPQAFQDTPMLRKPFTAEQLLGFMDALLARQPSAAGVVPFEARGG